MIGLKRQKRAEAGLIHWPHRVDTYWQATESSKVREAGPSDRPQKMSNIDLGLQLLHYVQTMAFVEHSVLYNNGNMGTASPCGWPENFSCHLPVFAVDVDLSDGGKLGYGFTSADDLE